MTYTPAHMIAIGCHQVPFTARQRARQNFGNGSTKTGFFGDIQLH
jgi:hypothetical protein